jgi:sugar phosphate isomerase/epimerase
MTVQNPRYPISFSTLACPDWHWQTILQQAAHAGYTGLELRGILRQMDLTQCPEFSAGRIQESLDELQAHQLRIVGLGASTKLHEYEPATRQEHLDEARRFIDLAQQLKASFVRVFPDKFPPEQPRQATIERIVSGLWELGEYAKDSDVRVVLETHGDVRDCATILEIMEAVAMPNVGIIWDVSHMFITHQEAPADVFRQLKNYIFHVHIKDCVRTDDGIRYVLLGEGIIPIETTLKVLAEDGYEGFYSLEWEKLWHPELEAPEIALPHAANFLIEKLQQFKTQD